MELFEKEKKQLKITVSMISIFEGIYILLDSIFLHFKAKRESSKNCRDKLNQELGQQFI